MLLSPKNVYSEKQKELACNLHFKSTSNYKFMRDQLRFHLPCTRSIYNYFPIKQLQPGFSFKLREKLHQLTKKMTKKDKQAVLVFDEITIRRDLDYNEALDLIDGFKHLSNSEREALIGKQICVFMLRGLYTNWKYVLNYFVSDTAIDGDDIHKIIKKNVIICKRMGIRVRAVCGDQGSNNRKAYRLFGVSYTKPYAIIDGEKVFFMYDVPHLIKSVRNNLLNHKSIRTPDGAAKWQHLQTIFAEDEKSDLIKRCPKLTLSHISPNSFEKMKVSYATQVLSKTVAAALKDLQDQDIVKDENNATYNFILNMNNLFDILNMRSNGKSANAFNQKGNPYKELKALQTYCIVCSTKESCYHLLLLRILSIY